MIEAFVCRGDDPYPAAGLGIVFVLAGFCLFSIFRAVRDQLKVYETAGAKTTYDFTTYVPLDYARECIRLSEQRMAELIASIQTYEKKALATIAGAATLIGFITTKEWCDDLTGLLATVCVLFGLLAAIFSGFIISTTDVGFGGAGAGQNIKYYHEKLRDIEYKEDAHHQEKKKEVEIGFLLLMVLQDYQLAIETSERAARGKAVNFACASNCFLVAFCSALAWLLIKRFVYF